jgi:hypothetical protein
MTLGMLAGLAACVLLLISIQRYVQPTGPARLKQAYIVFHTKDDDKDYDSYENINISAGPYKVGSLQNAGAGTVWRDQSDTPYLFLSDVDSNIEPSDCDKIRVDINHSTHGNDDWKFAFTVVLTFTDRRSFTYDYPDKITLTKDNGHGYWVVAKNS